MCGHLFIFEKQRFINAERASESLKIQSNRGPDFSDEKFLNISNDNNFKEVEKQHLQSKIYIGHNRLSIIDLSQESNQPILTKKFFLLYNGEFYNFKNFANNQTSNSDTLTLFKELKNNNLDIFKSINGMWSLVFADLNNKQVIFSRDRYGKKPLYYYEDKNIFISSTDTRSIFNYLNFKSRTIDLENLSKIFLLKLNSYNSTSTFYKNIKQVKPGYSIKLDINTFEKKIIKHKYFHNFSKKITFKDPINSFRHDFNNALTARMTSDRNIGFLVSGGVDSSMIISNLFKNSKNIENSYFYFARTFDKRTNKENHEDRYFAKLLSKKLKFKLNEIDMILSDTEIETTLKDMIIYFDQPFNFELTSVPLSLISNRMKEDNVPVLIDGAGGDEVMGGYPVYLSLAFANARSKNIFKALKYFFYDCSFKKSFLLKNFLILLRDFTKKQIKIEQKFKHYKFLNNSIKSLVLNSAKFPRDNYTNMTKRQLYDLFRHQIPFYLQINDSFCMKNSVENRSPFLDQNLLKYIYLEDNLKFNNKYNKLLLRRSMYENIPHEIVYRRSKQGLSNSFDIKLLKNERNIDMILSSKINRELMSSNLDKKALLENDVLFKFLFSMSILSEKYNLTI